MTLRRRLLVAVSVLAVLAVTAGVAVVLIQRSYLVARLDTEIAGLAQNPRALLLASQHSPDTVAAAGLGEVYVGRMGGDGRLVTVLAPESDPLLTPALDPGETIATPEGRMSAAGAARRVRVVTVTLPNGRAHAVIAVPTTSADVTTRRLALTLLLTGLVVAAFVGLLLGWVGRLGLAPIAAMTDAADAITAGDTERRVPPGPAGTEAARLGEALNTMIDLSAATHEGMRRFVADASHELRTPLTTLGGYAALHAARPPGPLDEAGRADVDDGMRRIGDEAARMRRLVDGLLDLTGLESPGALRLESLDLSPLLRDITSDLQVVAPDRSVTLEAPESLVVSADRDRVTQAVVGLTSNAVRHTPPGTPIALRLVADVGLARIEVADAGPGIPVEHLQHLFERFYRVDRSRSSGSGGSGLGLAVVDAVARAHGGSVAVTSECGPGTVFALLLPT